LNRRNKVATDQPRDDQRVAQKIKRARVLAKYRTEPGASITITNPDDIRAIMAGPSMREHPEKDGLVYWVNDL
jgi:hypothetical protein